MLNRMYELAEQSANGTYEGETDRAQLQKEVSQLKDEIDRIADSANFNGIKLLNGTMAGFENPDSMAITQTTPATASAAAVYQIDLTGFSVEKSGTMSISLGGVTVDVDVTAGMTAGNFATAVANALASKVDDGVGGHFTAAVTGGTKIKLTASANGTAANGVLSGNFSLSAGDGIGGLTLQIGDTSDSWNQLAVSILDTHVDSLGLDDMSIANQTDAAAALDKIKNAINYVSDVRGTLGATQNRLDHTINNLSVMEENIQDAESTIRDTDVAEEMMAYTKNNILIQSAQAMLAQANQVPQGVLQLLQ